MRHGDSVKKLSKTYSHRKSLLRNLSTALFKYESIITTVIKAKVLRSFAEKLITKAKKGDLHSIRLISRDIKDKKVIKKLIENIAPRYKNRNGGYTRIYRLGYRKDGSEMAIIELVEEALNTNESK